MFVFKMVILMKSFRAVKGFYTSQGIKIPSPSNPRVPYYLDMLSQSVIDPRTVEEFVRLKS